ncbi:MAG: hypothetical protein AAF959_11215 [Cyanobacteria bacterium P01_D01_bin.56]
MHWHNGSVALIQTSENGTNSTHGLCVNHIYFTDVISAAVAV